MAVTPSDIDDLRGEDAPFDLDENPGPEAERQAMAALQSFRGDRSPEEFAKDSPGPAARLAELEAKYLLLGEDAPFDLDENPGSEAQRQAFEALLRVRGDRTQEEFAREWPAAARKLAELEAKYLR